MRLNDLLITEFTYNGNSYQIDLAYDNVLDALDCLKDEQLWLVHRIGPAFTLLLGCVPDVPDLLDMWLYVLTTFIFSEQEEFVEVDIAGNPLPKRKEENYLDLEQDAEFIFSSFLQSYRINLIEAQGELTWVEFRALLRGLPQDTIMQQIIQIRQWKPYKGCSKEERQRMEMMQKTYSLRKEEFNG